MRLDKQRDPSVPIAVRDGDERRLTGGAAPGVPSRQTVRRRRREVKHMAPDLDVTRPSKLTTADHDAAATGRGAASAKTAPH